MILSVICPCLNEEKYIENILNHFIKSLPKEKELFIVDGGSQDRTIEIVQHWASNYSNIHLLHNPDRYVPFALNMAIPLCKGEYIVRIDAHSEYADNYYIKIVETFQIIDAEIVGGPTRTKANTKIQKAISKAISSPFGIGNSNVHFESFKGYTDSVTFGAWKKEIFKITGLFDTELVRNQDDEFHYRAKSKGFKIFQNPEIILYYYPRKSLVSLFSQYFQYGYYKPLVLKKVPSEWKIRHIIPSLFVLYILSLPLAFFFHYWIIPLMIYLLADLYFSLRENVEWSVKTLMFLVFPTIHFSYGLGFLMGLKLLWKK